MTDLHRRIESFINESSLLHEDVLLSEMTVGFELEAYCPVEDYGFAKELMEEWGFGVYEDQSVKAPEGNVPFEADMGYGPVTPRWLQTCVKRLKELAEAYEVRTNASCGFHAHFGLPGLKGRDPRKSEIDNSLLVYFLVREGALSEFETFEGIKQWDRKFANPELAKAFAFDVDKILRRDLPKSEKAQELRRAFRDYADKKMTLFNVHDSGTLEWRGLRGVLRPSMDKTIPLIKKYLYEHIYPFAKKLSSAMGRISRGELWEGTGITKQDLYDNVDPMRIVRRADKLGLSAIAKDDPKLADKLEKMIGDNHDEKLIGQLMRDLDAMQAVDATANPEAASIYLNRSKEIVIEGAVIKGIEIAGDRRSNHKYKSCTFKKCYFMAPAIIRYELSIDRCEFVECAIKLGIGVGSDLLMALRDYVRRPEDEAVEFMSHMPHPFDNGHVYRDCVVGARSRDTIKVPFWSFR